MRQAQTFLTAAVFSALTFAALPVYAEEAAASDAAPAAEEAAGPWALSGSLTLASEYMTRGFSDSDSHPALQGSVVLEHDSGWAAEVWASNVDYNDSWEAKAEVDFYLTYTFGLGPGDMSVGAGYYWYPGAERSLDYDHYEFILSYESTLPNDIATLGAEAYYSPDFLLTRAPAFISPRSPTCRCRCWRGSASSAMWAINGWKTTTVSAPPITPTTHSASPMLSSRLRSMCASTIPASRKIAATTCAMRVSQGVSPGIGNRPDFKGVRG